MFNPGFGAPQSQTPPSSNLFGQQLTVLPPPTNQVLHRSDREFNLRETDTLTEICHVAETVVQHPLNNEYRLKRVFVDASIGNHDPSKIPLLNPYEYIQAKNQAQRYVVDLKECVPTMAVGFKGLKERFDRQSIATSKQNQAMKQMKESIDRENATYARVQMDRIKKWESGMRKMETTMMKVCRKTEEGTMMIAIQQGKVYNVKSSLGECSRKVQKVQRTLRNENLSTRVATIQRNTQLRRPRTDPVGNSEEDPVKNNRKRVLTRQTRENVYSLKMKMDSIERDVKVMRPNNRN